MKFHVLILVTLFVLCGLNNSASGAKILGVFPMPSKSHIILAGALFKELVRKGHHVTFLTPFRVENPPPLNYTEILWNGEEDDSNHMKTWSDPKISGFTKLKLAIDHIPTYMDSLHEAKNIQKFLYSNDKYDLCIYLVTFADSFLGICNHVNATAIGFNTVGMNGFLAYMTRNPTPYSYVSNIFMPFSSEMTFLQRVFNTLAWTISDLILHFINFPLQKHLLHKHYPNAPPLDDLINNVDLILSNGHYATDNLMPLLPNIIPIGGFHLQEELKLSPELQNYLDESKHGVIYFNLGTNAKGTFINNATLQEILNCFAKLKYDVLWKYEEELPKTFKNIRTEKWLAQRPILMHPKIKVFITHGGQGGMVEAIYGGVPMICLPHYGDQNKNCASSVDEGYAINLNIVTLTEEMLNEAINEIINERKYKENVMLKSDLYRNQEINPMDRAMFWVEHVIKHKGAKHLKSNAANIPWYQYMLFDVIAFLGFIVSLLLGIIIVSFVMLKIVVYNFMRSNCMKESIHNVNINVKKNK